MVNVLTELNSLRYLSIAFTLCFSCLFSVSEKPKICLNMIVKDEKEVIERCLQSTIPIIDYWVIVDTGSIDGTQEIIKNTMKKYQVPGELYEKPWVNFCHNRNEALKLAKEKGDYILFIDADEYLEYQNDFKIGELNKDYYLINVSYSGLRYSRVSLINTCLAWKWEGVLHEVIQCPNAVSYDTIEGITNIVLNEGVRSKDPDTYNKDVAILENELKKYPDNSRYVFYLAQSYFDAKNYPLAFKCYKKRASMGGYVGEVYWSLLKMAEILQLMKCPTSEVITQFLKAYQFDPTRREPLYYMAEINRKEQNYRAAYQLCKIAKKIPEYSGNFFHYEWVSDYGILLEESISAYWLGKYQECQDLCYQLLNKKSLPKNIIDCVTKNLAFANEKLVNEVISDNLSPTLTWNTPTETELYNDEKIFHKKLLITGCARSGTKFISSVLNLCGVNIGHEEWGTDGCCSWTMAVDDAYSPWGVCGKEVQFEHIFHQVRHPLKVINSVYSTEPKRSWNYINKHIPEIDPEDSAIVKCAKYWYYWNLNAYQKAEFTYRIEDLENAFGEMSDILSVTLDKSTIGRVSKTINTRPHSCELTWSELERELPEKLLDNIRKLSMVFGYSERELRDYYPGL